MKRKPLDESVWSWVGQPENRRPKADGCGRYSRPLSKRDQIVAKAFGEEVRRLRIKNDLSTRELAGLVGMSQPAIIKIETDPSANIELRLLWDFAEALDVSPKHLIRVCEKAVDAGQEEYLSDVAAQQRRQRRANVKA